MKRKYWWFFLAFQITGVLAGAPGLLLQDGILFGASLILLLPGSLVLIIFDARGVWFEGWQPWATYAIILSTNTLLLAAASFLFGKARKHI